jgi:anthraniloyl-CoA monooxygenase
MSMEVTTIGGGPGGLYASLLLKRAFPEADVTVHERNPRGVTYGWGIVLPGRTLSNLQAADEPSYEAITDTVEQWEPFDTVVDGETYRCDGNTFNSMLRTDLLDVLQERCLEVGVELVFESTVTDPERVAAESDLVIAADGIHSRTREAFADGFGTYTLEGTAPFSWFGTDADFDALTHIFVEDDAGLWCAHTYPGPTSTFIVDCDAETWAASDVPDMDESEYLAYFEELFADSLEGHDLLSQRDRWQRFTTVRNESWYHDNVVLVGDAAHTAHYSIGSGTTLAMEDGIGLAEAFETHDDVEAALATYERTRKPAADDLQRAGERSRIHFEHIRRFTDLPERQFVAHHLTRSGRLTYDSLTRRDPGLVADLESWFRTAAVPDDVTADPDRPPALQPYDLGERRLANRLVRPVGPTHAATEGRPDAAHLEAVAAAASAGAGTVVTDPVAVSAAGRPTAGSPGLYDDDHVDAWAGAVDRLHDADVAAAVHLTHAGPTAAGDASPLSVAGPGRRDDAWTPPRRRVFPAPPRAFAPDALTTDRRETVREAFVAAADRAAAAGFDHVQVDAGRGVLGAWLASDGADSGTDPDPTAFPREVLSAVREALPAETSLGVTLQFGPGALGLDAGLGAANAVADAVDLVATTDTGVEEDRGVRVHGPGGYSDNVRNEVGAATLAGQHATAMDTANTLVVTGRADLCTYFGPPVG